MKRLGPIAGVLLVFILSALALVGIYDKGKDQKPLRYAEVPQETVDWINSLTAGLDDIFSTFDPIPRPTPWGNGGDVGKDPESGLEMLEDEYFIIYYPESLAERANLTLQYAHDAIPRMEDIIGKYYYPEDMNGRKVPIYLTIGNEDYSALYKKISGGSDAGNSDGVTIYEVSPSGLFLKGIILKGSSVFSSDRYHHEVQWHEMTHYCFAASLDYSQRINLPMWCTEGIAEYTGITGRRPRFSSQEIEMIRKDCDLSAPHFPYVFEVYSGGHCIFCYMEDEYKVSGVKAFLQTLYVSGIPASMEKNFKTTVKKFETDWKANLDRFKQ